MTSFESLISFSQTHPWPPGWPIDIVRRFFTQLISSDKMVLELVEQGERVAAAILLDKLQNPGNHACLEILGATPSTDRSEAFDRILALASSRVPSERSGFEVTLPEFLGPEDPLIARHSLAPYYETFGMIHDASGTLGPPPAGLCTIATDRDEEELYDVLKRCFADNVDTSVPEFADWQANRRLPSRSKTWGVWVDKALVAFLNLRVPNAMAHAEIHTIGVLPEFRGRGYAQALIKRALAYVAQLEIPRCALTVATRNASALELYRTLGFRTIDHRKIYVRKISELN